MKVRRSGSGITGIRSQGHVIIGEISDVVNRKVGG